MGSSPLSKIPISRITIPFCVGIILGDNFQSIPLLLTVIFAIIGCLLSILMSKLSRTPESRNKVRPFSAIPTVIISTALGWSSYIIHQPSTIDLAAINGKVGYGNIVSIEFKEQSMHMNVEMLSEFAQGSTIKLTTKGCNYDLSEGDNIAFTLNLQTITNNNIPEDIDFATISKRNGIIYQQHIDSKAIIKYGHHDNMSSRMAQIREKIKEAINRTSLSTESKHYIIALVLGDKKQIDRQTRNEYSFAGISHVLALSGLHIGIIMMFIWFILWPLDFYRLKKLRFILSVIIVLLYDFLTGFPPSVLRATIMISFTFATFVFGRKSSAINALMTAALLIVTFSPESLFNAGFQLSFVTVLIILILAPSNSTLKTNKKWIKYITTLVITSTIAMGATMALTAYYFHTISWAGVFSNILILPIFPFLMAIAILIIVLACGNINIDIINNIADTLINYINTVADTISKLPYAYSKEVYFCEWDVATYYICIAFFTFFLFKRKWIYFNLGIAGCAFGIIVHTIVLNLFSQNGCVLFNSFDSTPVVFYQNGNAHYWLPDDNTKLFNKDDFRTFHSGFFAAHSINDFTEVNDTTQLPNAVIKSPFAFIHGKTYLVVGKNYWSDLKSNKNLTIDYCIITKHFNGTIEGLKRLYDIKCIVISGNVYEPNIPSLIEQCKKMGIKHLSLREKSIKIE